MKTKFHTGITRLVLCTSMSAVLAACGGGGGSTASSGSPSVSDSVTSISGTVAIGHALANAPVTVTDITGKSVTVTSNSNGSYVVPATDLKLPLLITAVDKSGISGTLYSVVGSVSGNTAVANVTPLTTAVAALITSSGNPLDLSGAGMSKINSPVIAAAIAKLNNAIAPILSANQLAAASFDPIGGTFAPDQTGADAVIDSVSVSPSSKGTGLQITSLADPNTAIQLNADTTASITLAAPSRPANYLVALQSQFAQCMVDMSNGTTGSTACGNAIDASYKRGGKTSFAQAHPSFARKGATLTGIKTLTFLPAGTLPAITNPAALVYFLFTEADGTPNFGSDIVQQKPDGSWNIIGNQVDYNIYIASFLGRVQSTKDSSVRYESGLQIEVANNLMITNNIVNTVVVQGPGLPSGGLQLKPEYVVNNEYVGNDPNTGAPIFTYPGSQSNPVRPYMSIQTPAPTSIEVCGSCFGSATTTRQYKLTWAGTDGSAIAKPANTADYAPASVDLTTLPQFGVYTVTMYDSSAQQVGQPQKVLNIAQYANAAAGSIVSWPTLGNDTITTFLTPGGSDATGKVQNKTMNWSAPANAVFPNFWMSVDVTQVPLVAPPDTLYGVYQIFNSTKTLNSDGTYSSPFSGYVTLEGLNDELMRDVQFGWQSGGVYYTNTWQYKN